MEKVIKKLYENNVIIGGEKLKECMDVNMKKWKEGLGGYL